MSGSWTARDFTSGGGQIEHLLAAPGPGIELVGLVTSGPAPARAVLVARKPLSPAHVEVGLDQVRPESKRPAEETLGILVHFAFQIHQPKIIVCVEGRLAVVVQPDG